MSEPRLPLTLVVSIGLAAVLTVAVARVPTSWSSSRSMIARHLVVAELFTSEGCSSCPPADVLLQKITSASPIEGVEVLGLEEHVDYWDGLGWRDPFSSAAFSNRQSEYAARTFRPGQIYTPQLIVDGEFEAVGSDAAAVRAAIAAAASHPGANVSVNASVRADRTNVKVAVEVPAAVVRTHTANVLVAIAEDGLATKVERGENRDRTLAHSAVVRWLGAIDILKQSDSSRSASIDLPLAPGWRIPRLRVIAFVQERASLRILGASATALSAVTSE